MALNGIDVSRYQAGINLKVVPCDFVIVGTSDGQTVNPYADQLYQAAKAAGKLVGVYHYFRNDPITEARFWAGITKGYQDGKTVFFTDAETAVGNLPGVAKQFSDEFQRLTGIRPVTYTYWRFLTAYNWQSHPAANIGLWGAWYPLGDQIINGYNPPARQDPPYWGGSMAMWQYTSAGRLPGWAGDLDLNIFYGDKAAWYRYAAKAGSATPQGSTITPIPEGFLMALTDKQQADIYYRITRYLDAPTGAVPGKTATAVWATPVSRNGGHISALQELADSKTESIKANAQVTALRDVITQLAAGATAIDYDKVQAAVEAALKDNVVSVDVNVNPKP